MYTMDQVQDMLTHVHNDPKLKTAILKCFAHDHADQNAVADVISSGWVERFDRYDSAVCDDFIRAWEKCTKKKSVKESNNMKEYELEMEFRVLIYKDITDEELQSVADYLNSYFSGGKKIPGDIVNFSENASGIPGHPIISDHDIDFKKKSIYLLLYYKFEGYIEWDENGIGQPFYEFEGAPDPEDEKLFWQSIKNIVCSTPGVDLKPDNVGVKWEGYTLEELLDNIIEYESIGEYESKSVIGKLVEGRKIRDILL